MKKEVFLIITSIIITFLGNNLTKKYEQYTNKTRFHLVYVDCKSISEKNIAIAKHEEGEERKLFLLPTENSFTLINSGNTVITNEHFEDPIKIIFDERGTQIYDVKVAKKSDKSIDLKYCISHDNESVNLFPSLLHPSEEISFNILALRDVRNIFNDTMKTPKISAHGRFVFQKNIPLVDNVSMNSKVLLQAKKIKTELIVKCVLLVLAGFMLIELSMIQSDAYNLYYKNDKCRHKMFIFIHIAFPVFLFFFINFIITPSDFTELRYILFSSEDDYWERIVAVP